MTRQINFVNFMRKKFLKDQIEDSKIMNTYNENIKIHCFGAKDLTASFVVL